MKPRHIESKAMKNAALNPFASPAAKACLALALLSSIQNSSAAVVAWDDSFTGGSLNSNLNVSNNGGGTVTQTGGQLIMTGTTAGDGRFASVWTNATSTGATTIGGNLAYNYMANAVTSTFNLASLVSTSGQANTNQRPTFYYSIGQDGGAPRNYYGIGMDYGVSFNIENVLGTGWRIVGGTANASVFTENFTGNISGVPTSVTYDINNTSATITLAGATFTGGGGATASFSFNDLSGVGAFTQRSLAFGVYNRGNNIISTATLDSFNVTVVPEPSSFAMLIAGVAGVVLRRRRSRCTA